MENKYKEKALVCLGCGCVRNPDGYIIDRVTSIHVAERRGATAMVCYDCAIRNIASGFTPKKAGK